eukprot:TRINITY_DN7059_c0_g1_i1.p1 TRINITY_DN7059_c0_g1~~TRINITY_DN7059_c0_g1_i1.p1  ORF type:complete len:304 (+),score=83.37 TRINITY_DN7059_c0_g1_i1:62-913(+)
MAAPPRPLRNSEILEAMAGVQVHLHEPLALTASPQPLGLAAPQPLLGLAAPQPLLHTRAQPSAWGQRAPQGSRYLRRAGDSCPQAPCRVQSALSPPAPVLVEARRPDGVEGAAVVAEAAAAGLRVQTSAPWLRLERPAEPYGRATSPLRAGGGSVAIDSAEVSDPTPARPTHAGWRQNARLALPQSSGLSFASPPRHGAGSPMFGAEQPPGSLPTSPIGQHTALPVSPGSEQNRSFHTLNAIITHGNDLVLNRARALSDSILERHDRINTMIARRNVLVGQYC